MPDQKSEKEPNEARVNEASLKSIFKPAEFNPRFPNTNQTKSCWAYFLEYQRCMNITEKQGTNPDKCRRFRLAYLDMCPETLVDKYQSWVDEGRFPGQEAFKDSPKSGGHH